jgi:hypothetical protein
MMTSMQGSTGKRPSWLRVCILVVGYLVTLGACFYFFSLEMIYLAVAGLLIVFFASRGNPERRMTWGSTLIAFAGCLVIIGVLSLFGQDRIRHWKPHPGGYILAWFICFHAFRHFWGIFHNHQPDASDTA